MLSAEQAIAVYGNPQIEDGHTRIANELLEAITLFDFGKRHYKVVLFVLRKTYGWQKKADVMSLSQIVTGTGLHREHTCTCINELVAMKVLLKQSHRNGQLIELNKKYKEWKVLPKQQHVAKTVTDCYQNSNESVTKTVTTKETKKTIKRNIPENFSVSDRVASWAKKNGHSNLDKHLDAFVLACEKHGYKYANWDSAFMTAIRENWAKLEKTPNKNDWLKAIK